MSPSLGYMEVVQQRNAATLMPIITALIAPGSVIHSDMWAGYRRVQQLSPVADHHTVNHSLNTFHSEITRNADMPNSELIASCDVISCD